MISKKRICELLNSAPDNLGVIKVATCCGFSKDDLKLLEYGNCNCALIFLETLQRTYTLETIAAFQKLLNDKNMTGAAHFMSTCRNKLYVSDLSPEEIDKLSFKLTVRRTSNSPDWEDLCEHYRINVPQIKQHMKNYNQAYEMMRYIQCKYVDINIGNFLKALHKAGNNEIRMEVDNQIKLMIAAEDQRSYGKYVLSLQPNSFMCI